MCSTQGKSLKSKLIKCITKSVWIYAVIIAVFWSQPSLADTLEWSRRDSKENLADISKFQVPSNEQKDQ